MARRNRYKSLQAYVDAVHKYLTNGLGWNDNEADSYVADEDQFKGAWCDCISPSEYVDSDLNFHGVHDADGDGAYQ